MTLEAAPKQNAILEMRATTTRFVARFGTLVVGALAMQALVTESLAAVPLRLAPLGIYALPLVLRERWRSLHGAWLSLGQFLLVAAGILLDVGSGADVQVPALVLTVVMAAFCWSGKGALLLAVTSSVVLAFAPFLQRGPEPPSTLWLKTVGSVLMATALVLIALSSIDKALARESVLEARAQRLIQSSRDAILVLSERGEVKLENEAAREMRQRARAEVGELSWLDENSLSELHRQLEKNLGEPFELESTDHALVVEATLSRIESSDENWAFLLSLRDVSERRAAERSRELMEARIRESKSLESLGRLAGGVAHDFNNLLTVIIGTTELLLDSEELAPSVAEDLRHVADAGARAAELTAQLLAVARRQVLRPQILSPLVVVTELMPLLSRLLPESVEIRKHVAERLPNVKVDRSKLEQVLVNLVTNAADAMPGGGRLTIEVDHRELGNEDLKHRPDTPPGHFVVISVSDTGSGMSEETVDRVFEPFFSTKKERGNGLGLAIVHGIVRQSGGYIYVYSEPGRGTCFRLYFPATEECSPKASESPPEAHHLPPEIRVLLVEDQPAVRKSVRRMLDALGCRVTLAGDGFEALTLFRKSSEAFDLLLTDVVMPQMSGPELARLVAEHAPHLPVLYMSGYTENAMLHHGALDQSVLCLNKPFRRAELRTAILAVLDAHALRGPTEVGPV